MTFGWLEVSRAGSQAAGFFIDEKNRIVFWPKKKSPGYIVDINTVSKIFEVRNRFISRSILFFFSIGLVNVTITSFYSDYIFNNIFTVYGFFLPVLTLALFLPSLLLFLYWYIFLKKKQGFSLLPLLHDFEIIDEGRPRAQIIKPSEVSGKARIYLGWIFVFALSVLWIWLSAESRSENIFDFVFCAIGAATFSGVAFWSIWMEYSGLRKQDLRIYVPSEG
jgi:hypothetical protein